jgi:hypothetical protein
MESLFPLGQLAATECTIGARMGAGPQNAVEAEGLCLRYGRRWALVDLSFSAAPGRALMIAGHNVKERN